MLGSIDVVATVAVSNREAGKEFYGGILGLQVVEDNPGVTLLASGATKLFMYESTTAGHNEATSMTWQVDDIVRVIEELKTKGVLFERYEMEGVTHEGDVHVWGSAKTAWFKDPDGNILALNQMPHA